MFLSRVALSIVSFGLLAAAIGCSSDSADGDDPVPTIPEVTPATGEPASDEIALDFVLSDFAIDGPASVDAGLLRFNVKNEGAAIHELVIVRTDAEPDALPVESGIVVESDLDVIGEIEEFPGGESRSSSFQLDAGRYLLICNVPGHYSLGMVAELTVT